MHISSSSPTRLTYRDRPIVVDQDGGVVSLAVEDVAWLILDTPRISISGALLSALAEARVVMVVSWTDRRQSGHGIAQPGH